MVSINGFSRVQNWQREFGAQISQSGANHEAVLDQRLLEFRWLLEELRIGLFAQELRTPMPVSIKRLYKVWESIAR